LRNLPPAGVGPPASMTKHKQTGSCICGRRVIQCRYRELKGHGTRPTSQTNSCHVKRCNERAGKARHYHWPDAPHQRTILASILKDPDFSKRKSQGHKSSGHDFLFTLESLSGPDLFPNNLLSSRNRSHVRSPQCPEPAARPIERQSRDLMI
jgi:hypothetical protein